MLRVAGFVLFALCALASGCGYHAATSGRSVRLPASVNVIYVPMFANKTPSYHIEQTITADVVRELHERTRYSVVLSDNDNGADATLEGIVVSTGTSPLTYDSTTGRASSAVATVTMSVKLIDRKGRVLYEDANYTFRDQYEVSRELSSFFEEESPTLDRIARDLSRQLVADILEGF